MGYAKRPVVLELASELASERASTLEYPLGMDTCMAIRKYVHHLVTYTLHYTIPVVLEYHGTYAIHVHSVRTYVHVYVLLMLCHNFLIGKGHTSCALRTTCVLGGYTAAS